MRRGTEKIRYFANVNNSGHHTQRQSGRERKHGSGNFMAKVFSIECVCSGCRRRKSWAEQKIHLKVSLVSTPSIIIPACSLLLSCPISHHPFKSHYKLKGVNIQHRVVKRKITVITREKKTPPTITKRSNNNNNKESVEENNVCCHTSLPFIQSTHKLH